jgi:hypothetical protein
MKNFSIFASALLIVLSAVKSPVCAQTTKSVKQVAEIKNPENGADDQFGYSVAVSGNLTIVGSPQFLGGQSLAYLYAYENGNWNLVAKLEDSTGSDQFGWSVAVSKNVVAVGTPHAGNGGAVFIFVKPANGWKDMLPTAVINGPLAGAGLGASLAISSDGTTVAAGGPNQNGVGGVDVYVEPEGGWADTAVPTAILSAFSGYQIGNSLAMTTDTIVAGQAGTTNLQGAYVYSKPAGGWQYTDEPTAILTPSDGTSNDHFAQSVAISGNTILVGAPYHPDFAPGAAYVYTKPKTGWIDMTQTAELSIPVKYGALFAYSVGLAGNLALASAPQEVIGHSQQGAVFGYLKPAGGWKNSLMPNGAVTASDGQARESFGNSLAISGNNVVVGVVGYNGLTGAVYIFSLQ